LKSKTRVVKDVVDDEGRPLCLSKPGQVIGLELYQLTKDSSDLSWAIQMYQWVNTCLAAPGGLYYDHVNLGGTLNTTIWSYNQGTMVGAGALLYEISGTASYLSAAETTDAAAVSHCGTGTALQSQGPAFNGIYFRDLFVLNQVQPNRDYRSEAKVYAKFMWTQRASSGLFLQNGQTNGVNGTAPWSSSTLCWPEARPRRSRCTDLPSAGIDRVRLVAEEACPS
jgi:hypothetical protein